MVNISVHDMSGEYCLSVRSLEIWGQSLLVSLYPVARLVIYSSQLKIFSCDM